MSNNNLQNEINALKLLVDRMQQALTAANLELEAALIEKAEIERLRDFVSYYCRCPCCEQEIKCVENCTFSVDCPEGAEQMEVFRAALNAARGAK